MILSLSVSNYALIQELEIEFPGGLTTITGETGAGKSILMGALSLILGSRADISALKDKNKKCLVEGVFSSQGRNLITLLNENDVDSDENIILRREISPNGKSRSFINDTPVSLQLLKDVGSLLVDIHSQHENLNLNDNLYQLSVVDTFANNSDILSIYQEEFKKYTLLEKELIELKENSGKVKSELDFLQFQYNELLEANLMALEQQDIETELKSLNHAEEIKAELFTAYEALSGEEISSEKLLIKAIQSLTKIEKFHEPSAALRQRLESVLIEGRDIARECEALGEKAESDPVRLEFIRDRLNFLYSLQQKHNVKSIDELIDLKEAFAIKIDDLNSREFRIEGLEKEKSEQFNKVIGLANDISARREINIPVIQEKIISILVQLGIPNARFEISNLKRDVPGYNGFDNIRFLFTANRKTELQDISRVASGGELSRLMLSIKSIISGVNDLPTIIFDEIDSGVSGEIAFKVGKIMKDMSIDRQVFAITHLPQVASKGDNHFLVFKNEKESGTTTEIKFLNKEERLAEIAKMLSGEQTTEAAFANAKELLG